MSASYYEPLMEGPPVYAWDCPDCHESFQVVPDGDGDVAWDHAQRLMADFRREHRCAL